MADRPAKAAARSRLFDGRPQPGERITEIGVRDLGKARRDLRRDFGIGDSVGRALFAAQPDPTSEILK